MQCWESHELIGVPVHVTCTCMHVHLIARSNAYVLVNFSCRCVCENGLSKKPLYPRRWSRRQYKLIPDNYAEMHRQQGAHNLKRRTPW